MSLCNWKRRRDWCMRCIRRELHSPFRRPCVRPKSCCKLRVKSCAIWSWPVYVHGRPRLKRGAQHARASRTRATSLCTILMSNKSFGISAWASNRRMRARPSHTLTSRSVSSPCFRWRMTLKISRGKWRISCGVRQMCLDCRHAKSGTVYTVH